MLIICREMVFLKLRMLDLVHPAVWEVNSSYTLVVPVT